MMPVPVARATGNRKKFVPPANFRSLTRVPAADFLPVKDSKPPKFSPTTRIRRSRSPGQHLRGLAA